MSKRKPSILSVYIYIYNCVISKLEASQVVQKKPKKKENYLTYIDRFLTILTLRNELTSKKTDHLSVYRFASIIFEQFFMFCTRRGRCYTVLQHWTTLRCNNNNSFYTQNTRRCGQRWGLKVYLNYLYKKINIIYIINRNLCIHNILYDMRTICQNWSGSAQKIFKIFDAGSKQRFN